MKIGDMKTGEQVLEEQLAKNPAFREEWERLALARAVAESVSAYRREHGLSIRQLAEKLGVKHPQVVRLESGDHEPDLSSLRQLSRRLGLRFLVSVEPTSARRHFVRGRPSGATVFQETEQADGIRLLVAAG